MMWGSYWKKWWRRYKFFSWWSMTSHFTSHLLDTLMTALFGMLQIPLAIQATTERGGDLSPWIMVGVMFVTNIITQIFYYQSVVPAGEIEQAIFTRLVLLYEGALLFQQLSQWCAHCKCSGRSTRTHTRTTEVARCHHQPLLILLPIQNVKLVPISTVPPSSTTFVCVVSSKFPLTITNVLRNHIPSPPVMPPYMPSLSHGELSRPSSAHS